ncbi:MAG: anti-sigma factor [Myxococcales bacterium]|nr:MAG: anti-sigma factor [Myxococcales bacterium]
MKPLDPRAAELLCDEVLEGLDEAERRELADLLGDDLALEQHHIGLAAAAVDLAHLPATPDELPEALRQRVLASAAAVVPSGAIGVTGATGPRPVPASGAAPGAGAANDVVASRPRSTRAVLPWLVAAACLAAAVMALVVRPPAPPPVVTVVTVSVPVPPPPVPPASERRERLLAAGGAVVRSDWGGTKDPAATGASGDVVWNTATQEGYMRFAGLPANDPGKEQYQLWIFDRTQDERHPVDGGVFDVGPGGEVVVPITAKIQVREPTLFAVTIEKPGGVVVSSRKRLVLAAKVPTG